jgi:hypothetical protein
MALAPWLTERAIQDARATIRAELATASDPDQRLACAHALDLISYGVRRFRIFDLGMWVRARR